MIAHRLSASCTSVSGTTPSRRNARETRSCSATSQTIVRRPARAAATPSAAATVVLPTPPLPVTYSSRLSRRSASIVCGKDDNGRSGHQRGLRGLPAAAAPARPHLLLGHATAARGRPAGHARALRLRPHGRRDRRRPAPPADRRGPPRGARRLGGGARSAAAPARSSHPVVGALVDAGERHHLPLDELGIYMRVDARRLRPGADRQRRRARPLHGRLGRLGRPDHGRAARRAQALPRRLRAASARRSSSTNFIRDVGEDWEMDRIYLPGVEDLASRRRRAARRRCCARSPAARALFAVAEPAIAAAPASMRSGIRLAVAAYLRILDRAEATGGDVLGRRIGVRARDVPAILAGGPAMTRRATLRGAERTPLDERADVLICGASFAGLAVARELAGCGADVLVARPLRDRRARDLRLRGADAVAARDGRRARDPAGARVHGVPHAARLRALPAAVELVELRLPRAVRGAVGADATRGSRSRRSTAAAGETVHTDRGDVTAPLIVDGARLAARARPRRQRAAARGAHLPRSRGPSARRARRRPGGLDRPQRRPLRLRLVGARARRAARRRRLLRAAPPRQGADPGDGAPARDRGRPLPGQLVPARAAARPPRTASSSSATAPATASRCRARGFEPPSTSARAAGREIRAVLAGAEAARGRRSRRTATSPQAHAPFFRAALRSAPDPGAPAARADRRC